MLLLQKKTYLVTVGAKGENKLGIRGSDTHSILFNDVKKCQKKNRIGEDGFGFKLAGGNPEAGGRIELLHKPWVLQAVLMKELAYSKQRKAFGKEIMHHQAIQFKLADMATKIECARMLCLKAAWGKRQWY